jgi:hypothetical protein
MSKIIELVNNGKYTELKSVLEEKVVKKIGMKIKEEKEAFLKDCRKKKEEGTTKEGESTTSSKGE